MTNERKNERPNQKWLALGLGIYSLSTLVSMAAMSIGAFVLVIALLQGFGGPRRLFANIREGARDRFSRRYLRIALVLVGCCALSLFWAKLSPMGYGGKFVHVELWPNLSKLWYLLWPLPIAAALGELTETLRYQVLRSWLIGFFLLSILGVIQFYTGWPRPQLIPNFFGDHPRYHATLFLGHHLSVASIFIFPFFAGIELLRDKAKCAILGLPRSLVAAIVLLGAWTLFLTYSRTLWVSLPIGLLLWALWNLPWRGALRPPAEVGGKFAGIAGLVAAGVFALSQSAVIQSRLRDSLGVATRYRLWEANWEFFRARPWFGVGWRQNQELSGIYLSHLNPGREVFQGHAHNNFLDMLAGAGLFGSLAWLSWCAVVFWVLWPSARKAISFSRGLFCAWVVFQLNGLTQLNFWEAKVTHQMMLMVAWSLFWARQAKEQECSG